jgi:hypothetical protein
MEYLVTMTTLVPEGTAEETVQEIRSRETARSRELAARGTCFVCGALRCSRVSGAPSGCSPPAMRWSSRTSSPRCHCAFGAPIGLSRCRPIPTTRPCRERRLPWSS